jgi:hypothetical protein
VNRRRLYEEKGFSSIFEFSAKLCGLSVEQVRLALNLEKRFENKPVLKKMLENGESSIHKLTRIASIATPENEEELAEKVKVLSKSALDTLVRDIKVVENIDGLQKPLFEAKSLPVQTLKFQLSDDVTEELNELHSKGIDVNELLREMLKRRREDIAKEKEEIAAFVTAETIKRNKPSESQANQIMRQKDGSFVSRYIPVRIKKILKDEYGEKCSITTCQKLAETIHHTQRFSLSQNHDPRFLAPLCHDHHVIAHSIDVSYHRVRAEH